MSTISSTSPTRNGTGPLAITAQPAALAELVDREAMAYREQNTVEGEFLARHLDRLAQSIRFVGASTPKEFDERIEVLEAGRRQARRHD
jgi:hypothetical protein